ncbi:MAG: electron transfer flavoprotein subunit alpha [Clostridia bacterium]|nr:electron transfer flavoprotein subunit alpha [Clostridia bacterium]
MEQIAVLERKCTGCGACVVGCPFEAIEMVMQKARLNAACRACGICVKACPEKAIVRLEAKAKSVDKSKWRGILVFAEQAFGTLHPVVPELIGKARQLAEKSGEPVYAVLIGADLKTAADSLRHYGVDEVYCYDDPALSFFRADVFTDCFQDCIRQATPSAVLVGATALGRSLAPRVATRFRTGLTADCTAIELREDSNLVQIRPAFGGDIMAQIVTPETRPQFATVRYKVMDAAGRNNAPGGKLISRSVPRAALASPVRLISTNPVPPVSSISDAEIIVAAGRGVRAEADLGALRELAGLLGGEFAVTRPLVERGWESNARQIGLSGRTVRPKLLIAAGISGAIQFTASMSGAEHIIAVNTDDTAPIFGVAHVGIIGDLYQIIPDLLRLCSRSIA